MNKSQIAPVVLSEYDQTWPEKYLLEKTVLEEIIGNYIQSIEHIGSTSVAGMIAKPEIDILVGITSLKEITSQIPLLQENGYAYYPRFEEFVPERRYFRKSEGIYPLVHVHIVEISSDFYKDHIAFRDALRNDGELRARYATFKRLLLKESRGDRLKYDKQNFIKETLKNLKQHHD